MVSRQEFRCSRKAERDGFVHLYEEKNEVGPYGYPELYNGGCRDTRAAERCLERNDKRHQAKLVPGRFLLCLRKTFFTWRDMQRCPERLEALNITKT